MDALKSKVRKAQPKFKVVNVKGTTVGGEMSLVCKFSGSSDLRYVHVDSKFEAPYGRELARWLLHHEIAPEFKPTAANAINRLLGELGIDACRLTVEAPRLADQASSDGTLHRTLPLLSPLLAPPRACLQKVSGELEASPPLTIPAVLSGPKSTRTLPREAVRKIAPLLALVGARGRSLLRKVHHCPPLFAASACFSA
jgi:hypothetical protein